jgi:signal transduction histidine kinase
MNQIVRPSGIPLGVLIVEDNERDAMLLLRELKRGGYEVSYERVDTPEMMTAALDRRTWDIVLSDYSMPRFSAPAALAVVKERGLDLPFIIISGTIGEETAVASLRAGAHDFLVKGALARLLPAIERELREAASRAERKRIHEQLLMSERMASVGTLAAGVAHEINNPLAIVVGNLDVAMERLADLRRVGAGLSEIEQPLHDAQEAAERVRVIVRDLKMLSRSGDEEHHGPVDIHRVLDSALRMASNEIRHRARLVRQYSELPPVEGNEARLGQLFLNLVINAAQSIAEGRAEANEIRIVTARAGEREVAVEVHDTGCGIPRESLKQIFDAFYTTKPIGIGTGLGLAICHRIVTSHGGTIAVESEVGSGTVFRINLPVSRSQATVSETPTERPAMARRARILVIDDEEGLCSAIQRILESEHDVATVNSAAAALKLLKSESPFDLILCDLMMPEMTGMDLHAELAQSQPDLAAKMIFMTGGAFTENASRFLEQHPGRAIDKPFKPSGLRERVRGLVGET